MEITISFLPLVNLLAIAFAGGALWRQVQHLDSRLERIEKLLNGKLGGLSHGD